MIHSFNFTLAEKYTSSSQKIRVMTEGWAKENVFCPSCGNAICEYANNKPVADFFCEKCTEDFELKSKKDSFGTKIVDGAYSTMIERIESTKNPNFFFLNYDTKNFVVQNFLILPKHFFVPEIIEKRKPLSQNARRAGWTGCNILLSAIPESGKIFYIKDGKQEPKEKVLENWNKTLFLRDQSQSVKGWTLDVLRCVDLLKKEIFTLDEIYQFDQLLSEKHPENQNIRPKIRQQLQILRDKNFLEFLGNGRYKKL